MTDFGFVQKEIRKRRMGKEPNRLIIFILMLLLVIIIAITFVIIGARIKLPEFKSSFPSKSTITGKEAHGHVFLRILPKYYFLFSPGWNFFSLCADPKNKTIAANLGNITYRYILRWNTSRMEWDIYSPRATKNPFENFTLGDSFFALAYANQTVFFDGDENEDMNITMIQGWNAPSWPYIFDTNVTKYLNESRYRYMMKWSNSLQEWIIYSPRMAEKPFTKIFKAEGQMLYAYFNHTLEYNKTYLQDP